MSLSRRQFLARSIAAIGTAPVAFVVRTAESAGDWPAWRARVTDQMDPLRDFFAGCRWTPDQQDALRALGSKPIRINKIRMTA
ncbi:MAG: hypothetical protein H6948_02160 [Zoogloeaceae bacterium]|nr:hypothetical protein [Zoogloeaceae bacterium]